MEEARAWGLELQSARRGREGLAWVVELLRQSGLRKRKFLAMEEARAWGLVLQSARAEGLGGKGAAALRARESAAGAGALVAA